MAIPQLSLAVIVLRVARMSSSLMLGERAFYEFKLEAKIPHGNEQGVIDVGNSPANPRASLHAKSTD